MDGICKTCVNDYPSVECTNCGKNHYNYTTDKYNARCTKSDNSNSCCGYYKGYCVSIENYQYQKPVLTNYERIKNMSIEEMADFMANHLPVSFDCACDLEPLCGNSGKFDDCCVNAFYEYLNSEVKNEDN